MNARNKIFAVITFGMLATGLYSARGVAQTTPAPTAPVGVTLQFDATTKNNNIGPDFTAFTRVLYIAPGGGLPVHWHPGPFTVMVLEGELTHEENGKFESFKVGESWTAGVGPEHAHGLWNKSKAMAKYVVMGLVPKGDTPQTTYGTK
jgi:quercetin dioxygenase-like cupin family protein